MKLHTNKPGQFKGKVGGVVYDEPTLFETAARRLGYSGYGRRSNVWKVGTDIAVVINGETIHGQVWAPTDTRNYVWVALDSGRYVAVFTPTGQLRERPRGVGEWIGRVA